MTPIDQMKLGESESVFKQLEKGFDVTQTLTSIKSQVVDDCFDGLNHRGYDTVSDLNDFN